MGAVSQKKAISIELCVALGTAPSRPASAPTVCSATSSSAALATRGSICSEKVRSRAARSASHTLSRGRGRRPASSTAHSPTNWRTRVAVVASGEPTKPRPVMPAAAHPCTRTTLRPMLTPKASA